MERFVINLTKETPKKRNPEKKSRCCEQNLDILVQPNHLINYIGFRPLVQGEEHWQNAQFLEKKIGQKGESEGKGNKVAFFEGMQVIPGRMPGVSVRE